MLRELERLAAEEAAAAVAKRSRAQVRGAPLLATTACLRAGHTRARRQRAQQQQHHRLALKQANPSPCAAAARR